MCEQEGPTSVSVVIPHFGDPTLACTLVESLMLQTALCPREIVVVDDASPIAMPTCPGATVVRRSVNGGFGAAVNTGVEHTSGRLLLILNSDLAVGPTFVQDLVQGAEAHQPCVTGPSLTDEDPPPRPSGRHYPTAGRVFLLSLRPTGWFLNHRWLLDLVGHDVRCRPGRVVEVDWVSGAAMLIPRGDFTAVGGFDEDFFMFSEEIDLQRRLAARGLSRIFLGTVTVRHAGAASTDPGRRQAWLENSTFLYFQKWGGAKRLKVALLAAAALNSPWDLRSSWRQRSWSPLVEAWARGRTIWSRPRG